MRKAAVWGVGLEVLCKEGPRRGQLGCLARHSLLPDAPWGSKPCHHQYPLAESHQPWAPVS